MPPRASRYAQAFPGKKKTMRHQGHQLLRYQDEENGKPKATSSILASLLILAVMDLGLVLVSFRKISNS